MDHMTAKVSCFARAYHHKNNQVCIFDDPMAEKLLRNEYEQASWKQKLLEAGYQQTEKAFGSLLGISYYLQKEEFEQLLKNVHKIMAAGSMICFDYPSVDESKETRTNQTLASGAGEQMKALYSRKEMEVLLQRCGFAVMEHLDDREMTDRYFAEYNQNNPTHPMKAPKGVGYVLASD